MELILIIIFILVYSGIIFNPFKIKELYYCLFGIILLLLFSLVSIPQLFLSLIKFDNQEPWKILIFFTSIAIFSISLDKLNFFKYLSIKVIHYSNHDGIKLYTNIFLLSAITSFFLSNDVVILTLTPLIINLIHHSKINPIPYLITMFIVANTSSIGLITSNTTNLIVSNNSLFFFDYFLLSIIPLIITLLFQYFFMKWIFYKKINIKFKEKKIDINSIITKTFEVKAFLIIGLIMLILFSLDKILNLQIWIISLVAVLTAIIITKTNFNDLIKRIPYNPIFIVSFFFIFINLISKTIFYNKIIEVSEVLIKTSSYLDFTISTFYLSFVNAFFLNIPTTTLFNSIYYNSNLSFMKYVLIISSNLGANLFIMGSLAGLMWYHLIKEKNINISIFDFMKYGFIVTIPSIFIVSISYYFILTL